MQFCGSFEAYTVNPELPSRLNIYLGIVDENGFCKRTVFTVEDVGVESGIGLDQTDLMGGVHPVEDVVVSVLRVNLVVRLYRVGPDPDPGFCLERMDRLDSLPVGARLKG